VCGKKTKNKKLSSACIQCEATVLTSSTGNVDDLISTLNAKSLVHSVTHVMYCRIAEGLGNNVALSCCACTQTHALAVFKTVAMKAPQHADGGVCVMCIFHGVVDA
jgi:hypothetical protein